MSELKAYNTKYEQILDEVYLKSEADKVIEELEEKRDTAEKLLNKALGCVSNGNKHIISLARKNNHSNYKRCLAMARWCRTSARCDEGLGAFKYRDWYWKWFKRWLELAEKFKEEKK